jgi:aminoglycoside phosphotransferase family enzyme
MPEVSIAFAAKVAYLRGLCGQGDEAIETHFAWVFLVGDHAWKLRKPLARDTMDYRLLEARHIGSLDEVRLNRRLAPRVYREATPLVIKADGTLSIGGGGITVDWLVAMQRLDRARLLVAQLPREAFCGADLEPVTRLLAAFYDGAPPAVAHGPAFVERLERQVAANHAVLGGANRPGAERLQRQQRAFIVAHASLLQRRAASGCVVEGHGDLRPEHLFLGDPPAVIDCLEFDRDLRILDRAEELSFLELECARVGHARVGRDLARRCLALLGDPAPDALLAFYRSHRAATRAKLYVWRAGEPDTGTPSTWLERADGYIAGALSDSALSLA